MTPPPTPGTKPFMTKQKTGPKPGPQEYEPKRGRPVKDGGRVKISFYIESAFLAKLDAIAEKSPSNSRSDALNDTLRKIL